MRPIVFVLAVAICICLPIKKAQATALNEFITSCTYGMLAGTLVGAASLAFSERPGDKLKNIAQGASLGLYAGIILGVYVVYIVPSQNTIDEDNSPPIEELEQQEDYESEGKEEEETYEDDDAYNWPTPTIFVTEKGIGGAGINWRMEF
jgi:hypothetical protein